MGRNGRDEKRHAERSRGELSTQEQDAHGKHIYGGDSLMAMW